MNSTVMSSEATRWDGLGHKDFKDEIGLREEGEQGRTLGMDGKTLIQDTCLARAYKCTGACTNRSSNRTSDRSTCHAADGSPAQSCLGARAGT
jgi:hypothetical protein